MLAELRRGAMRLRRRVAKLDGAVHDPASGNIRMIDGRESADCGGLRIVENLGVSADGRPDEIVTIENRRPFVGDASGDCAIDFGGERGAVLRSSRRVLEA